MSIDPRIYDGLAGFRYALRQFMAYSEALTADAGVTAQQYHALLIIRTYPPEGIMIKELADQLLIQHHGAVQLVDRLANAGLVQRQRSPNDGRSVLIVITETGEGLLEDLATHHIQELLRHEPLLAESLRRLRQLDRQKKIVRTG
ncbi:MAG TPA: MarR family transcriptional regulator [Stellaceae bacterium]|nr:MarR family transcriptional regulator [Stellaceae bacterium]